MQNAAKRLKKADVDGMHVGRGSKGGFSPARSSLSGVAHLGRLIYFSVAP